MADSQKIFGPGAPKVWSIPPGVDFLKVLAETLSKDLDLARQRDALADAIIYVPNRRSATALQKCLYEASGSKVLLPPDIRPLGDLDSAEAPPSVESALAGRPEAMEPAERLGRIGKLVLRFYQSAYSTNLPPNSALAAARELSGLLEQAALSEDVDWSRLEGVVESAELAGHWGNSVRFLNIIAEDWPKQLAEAGKVDPLVQRLVSANAMAAAWKLNPPTAPVIIAGSTGATPAGKVLMRAVMELPNGMIILPGLDQSADDDMWTAIRGAVAHPQNTFIDTLDALEMKPSDVSVWPGIKDDVAADARRRIIHEALAPAEQTADWRDTLKRIATASNLDAAEFTKNALSGLSVLQSPDEAAEAQSAALLMREALEANRSAAFVTPDAGLARRVSALLKRWDIDVPPSAGQPLGRTPAGSLIGLCAAWAVDPGDPVLITAVLRHPFVTALDGAADLERFFLRGPRRWTGLRQLKESVVTRHEIEPYPQFEDTDQTQAVSVIETLIGYFDTANADLSEFDEVKGDEAAERIAALAGVVSDSPLPWAGEDGRGASQLLEFVSELSTWLGPMRPTALADLMNAQSAQMTVSAGMDEHPLLSIRGPLEARLLSADRVILSGLNEDVWPQRPSADAFLPRHFRTKIGLNDPEDRMGLSAHDFAQLACAPEVWALYSARRDDAPAVASRWIWRLQTLVRGALTEQDAEETLGPQGDNPLTWTNILQHRGIGDLPADFSAEPKPTKKPAGWPKRLSVTRVDVLQRDPYSLWSENVLGLSALDAMNTPLGPRERGTAIHKALEDLEDEGAPKSVDHLMALLEKELLRVGEAPADFAAKRAVWRNTCDWYMEWRGGRDTSGGALKRECPGKLERIIAGEPFVLSANADRIERNAFNGVSIVDFKTGSPATDKMIATGLDQQMPLQALIAREGGYEGVAASEVTSLDYVAFKAKPDGRTVGGSKALPDTPGEMADKALEGLFKLIAAYRVEGAEFLSAPRVQFVKYDNGFNRLARRAEWAGDTDDGAGEES